MNATLHSMVTKEGIITEMITVEIGEIGKPSSQARKREWNNVN